MESNQNEANTLTCRWGKVFNDARNTQRHGKRCKFVPFVSAVDEDEDTSMADVSNTYFNECASFLISIA